VEPLGSYVVQGFDALGELVQQVFYGADGVAQAANGYTYEPAGLVAYQTNAPGGSGDQ
jgi:hypothetical protein